MTGKSQAETTASKVDLKDDKYLKTKTANQGCKSVGKFRAVAELRVEVRCRMK